MACSRGKAHPNSATKLRLFTDSGGYCQNTGCNNILFFSEKKNIHLAEMAHVFAAIDDGTRTDKNLTPEERGNYNNLILLCSNCHTKIDKDPETYTDKIVLGWKFDHAEKLAATFGIRSFIERGQLRNEICRLLEENRAVHNSVGPDNDYRWNPEAAEADAWKTRMVSTIIPNSNLIIRHLDSNKSLLSPAETQVLAEFKVHVRGLILKHIVGDNIINIRYPTAMNDIGA